MKVFGIGWHKTGTKTLGKCLSAMGFDVQSWDGAVFDLWAKGGPEALLPIAEQHDAFEDWPWPFAYELLSEKYPDAKFILTYRKDSATWYRSFHRHAQNVSEIEPEGSSRHEIVYGHKMPNDFPKEHIAIYENHNREVRKFFNRGLIFKRAKPNFLEICFENGDGWDKISRFVGRPIPDIPLPHENRVFA